MSPRDMPETRAWEGSWAPIQSSRICTSRTKTCLPPAPDKSVRHGQLKLHQKALVMQFSESIHIPKRNDTLAHRSRDGENDISSSVLAS